jgi:hypothetical protein
MEFPRTKSRKKRIDGLFFPWLIEMGTSAAMARLRKNSNAVNTLTMFISKYTQSNDGKNLAVTYGETKGIMSPATFACSKLWCCAFGFLHCRKYGRLERHASLYDLSTKWRHLSRQPDKLNRVERLLGRREHVYRIPKSKIKTRNGTHPKMRRRIFLRMIEKRMLSM